MASRAPPGGGGGQGHVRFRAGSGELSHTPAGVGFLFFRPGIVVLSLWGVAIK